MSFARRKAPCAERAQPQRAAPAECSMSVWRTGKCERLHASRPGTPRTGASRRHPTHKIKRRALRPPIVSTDAPTGAASISSGKPCPGAMRRPCCGCRRGRRYSSAPAFPAPCFSEASASPSSSAFQTPDRSQSSRALAGSCWMDRLFRVPLQPQSRSVPALRSGHALGYQLLFKKGQPLRNPHSRLTVAPDLRLHLCIAFSEIVGLFQLPTELGYFALHLIRHYAAFALASSYLLPPGAARDVLLWVAHYLRAH